MEIPPDNCTSLETPEAVDYLSDIEVPYLILTAIGGFVVLVTQIMFLSEVLFILRHINEWVQPGKTIWLLGLYTVFGWTGFIGMIVPRSGDLGNMIATMYLSSCLYVFKRMMMNYYGGRARMLNTLEGEQYNLRSPPCCCCCCCLPDMNVTSRSSHAIEAMVLQFAIIQPILVYLEAILIADLRESTSDNIPIIISSIGTASSLVALYGLMIFYRVSRVRMAHIHISAKFICLKLIVGIDSLQKLIVTLLVERGMIPCTDILNPVDNASRILRFMIIIEAFLISLLARIYYKRDRHLEFAVKYPSSSVDENEALISNDTRQSTPSTLVGSSERNYGTNADINDARVTKHQPVSVSDASDVFPIEGAEVAT